MKKEEHKRTDDDTDDDDEGDKREQQQKTSARERNNNNEVINAGNTVSPSSFHHQFLPDGTAVPGPSASWYLFQFQKKRGERERKEGGGPTHTHTKKTNYLGFDFFFVFFKKLFKKKQTTWPLVVGLHLSRFSRVVVVSDQKLPSARFLLKCNRHLIYHRAYTHTHAHAQTIYPLFVLERS